MTDRIENKNIEQNITFFSSIPENFSKYCEENKKKFSGSCVLDFKKITKAGILKALRIFLQDKSEDEKKSVSFMIYLQHYLSRKALSEILEIPDAKIPEEYSIESFYETLTVEQKEKVQSWVNTLDFPYDMNFVVNTDPSNVFVPTPRNPVQFIPSNTSSNTASVITSSSGLRIGGWSSNPRAPNPNSYRHTPHIRVASTVPHQPNRPNQPVPRNNNDRVRSLAELKAIMGEK